MFQKHPTLIEQTQKRWKGYQAAGCLGVVIGSILLCSGLSNTDRIGKTEDIDLGMIVALLGVVSLLLGTIGRWWYHR